MANRDNHYEAAFEEYLRRRCLPYVAIDETKRSRFGDGTLKSLDFIVSPQREENSSQPGWLIDVKGRRFPSGERQQQYWKNWSTREDLRCLAQWQQLFGGGFGSMFVFAYNVVGDRSPLPEEQLFEFRDSLYGFVGIELGDYARWARPISPAWDTVAMPTSAFRSLAAPVERFF